MNRPTASAALLAAFCVSPLQAQDDATPPTAARTGPTTKLQAALRSMAELPSLGFATETIKQKPKQAQVLGGGRFAINVGGPLEGSAKSLDGVEGVWTPEVLYVTHEDQPMVFANRRMVTEGDDGWVLRQGHTAGGFSAPLVLDPGLWFTLLSNMDLEVTHSDVGSLDDRPVQRLSVTLDADQVAQLDWAGQLPANTGDLLGGGAAMFQAIAVNLAAGAGGAAPKNAPVPERMLDLVFVLDPASNTIHEVQARQHDKTPEGMGGAMIMVNGGGIVQQGGDDDDEEDEEEAEGDEPQFKDGFPVRPKKQRKKLSSCGWVVRFSDHGAAKLPEIPGAARKLLGRF